MRSETIALNYAEALFQLGQKSGQSARYADLLDALAGALEVLPQAQAALMSPRVTKAAKARILAGTMRGEPQEFVLFLQAVVKRGRQGLFREIATAYLGLLDITLNRVRAGVTLAREPGEALKAEITAALATAMGKEVITHFATDPAIMGGAVVRVGSRVYDGSVRRKISQLRRQLLKQ